MLPTTPTKEQLCPALLIQVAVATAPTFRQVTDRLLMAIPGVEGIAMAKRGSRGRTVLTLAIIFDVGVLVDGILHLLLAVWRAS